MSERRRVRVRVAGRVQGVFFRVTCAREARRLGVAGWVENLPDGDVEAVFEGEATGVEAMSVWCEHGSPGAAIVQVERIEEPAEGLEGFEIRG